MKNKRSFKLHCSCGVLDMIQFENDKGEFCTTIYCKQEKDVSIQAMRRTLRGILFNLLDHFDEESFNKLCFSDAVESYYQDSNNLHGKVKVEKVDDSKKTVISKAPQEILEAGRALGQ